MILQALVDYYESLVETGEAARPGWSPVKVSYALCIDKEGKLLEVIPLKVEQTKGKKTVLVPQEKSVPAPVKRSSGISPNFLCDNSSYILGVDDKGKGERTLDCFSACRELHKKLLSDVLTDASQAVLAFFDNWEPQKAAEHPALQEYYEDIITSSNLIFRFNGSCVHEYPEIIHAWQNYYDSDDGKEKRICLITGNEGTVAETHPSIKGVRGAQSSGASLVSFNAPAFCSYGREQGMNAPTSEYAAFAYGTALNYLIADREHTSYIGDTLVLCWSSGGEKEYQDFFCSMMYGNECSYSENELRTMANSLCRGERVEFDSSLLDPGREFYVLGLSPNAARLSVRFFLRNSFGRFIENVNEHHERLEITRPDFDKFDTLPLWKLMSETVNQNSNDKSPSPILSGEVLRAILNGTIYPATLINSISLRIRAEHQVTRGKAAIIKAYYLKNTNPDVPKEVLTVALNADSNSIPYNLGRLFSVLEAIQEKANPGINATIKDKYFNSASATPAVIFPILINLAQKHLKKLDGGIRVFYEKQLGEITEKLGESYPQHLNLPEQGAFQLGYYHQTQARYQRKDKEDK